MIRVIAPAPYLEIKSGDDSDNEAEQVHFNADKEVTGFGDDIFHKRFPVVNRRLMTVRIHHS